MEAFIQAAEGKVHNMSGGQEAALGLAAAAAAAAGGYEIYEHEKKKKAAEAAAADVGDSAQPTGDGSGN
ncbi:hypothetical protein FRB96_006059 [Tulasnella sp. 330]|nr:hypothetical protein FRB96_006059 [Tulasnella sp. 330]KAG8878237.1 hypothetical protein FRB98_006303 [Tulasnella sp. 332]